MDEPRGDQPPPMALPPNDILGYGPISDDLDGGRLGLIWGEACAFADHPDKPFEDQSSGELLETSVTYNVFEAMRLAQKEIVVVVAVLRARAARHGVPSQPARPRHRAQRDDELARRDRRAGGPPRLQALPRGHAADGASTSTS